ncbi:MAG TPA: amidase family protein [Opitutaceae bacterium]|nr:amidase family protein [Opitutaceae bacterium]
MLDFIMTFADWSHLGLSHPEKAAHLVRERAATLPAPQQKAVLAWLPTHEALVEAFTRARDYSSPLAGVPYLLKDLFPVRGVPTRAGSAFLPDVRPTPTQDSALVQTLGAAGAILAGTTHLHEFAYGLTGENVHWGDVAHPRFPDRTTGGSSSGSAAAVAADIVPFAMGTDTGGSIRVPAAFCGLHGVRFTPHHSWIADAFPLARSFDTAGWFTQTAEDMATALTVLMKPETAVKAPSRGVFLDFDGWLEADTDVRNAYRPAAERLASRADEETRQELLHAFTGSTQAYAVLQSVEAFDVHRDWLDLLKGKYGAEVWQRIDRGRRWTDEQLESAQAKRATIHLMWTRVFQTYDYLILPATPFPALRKSECTLENRNRLLALTTPASLGGLPVLTLPLELPSGLSSGLQVIVNSNHSPVFSSVLNERRR